MGIQTSTLANCSFSPPKKAYTPYDFMPSKQREKRAAVKPKRWTRQNFANEIRQTMRMLGPGAVVFKEAEPKKEG